MTGMPERIPAADCLVCGEHRGAISVPGGFLVENDQVIAFHAPPLPENPEPYLGHLLVTTRRHVPGLGQLTPQEGAALGVALTRLSAALESCGASRVYLAAVGHHQPHVHVHLVPRYPETPVDVAWHQVDEWAGARRGGAAEIEQLVADLSERMPA